MGDWRRHAIYFAPPRGSGLARFGAGWLGWDPETASASRPRGPAEMVAAPARYGFHATLKAPFRLAAGEDVAALDAAAGEIAGQVPAFGLRLKVATIGGFVALVPVAVPAGLAVLEAALVRGLDRFRAPSSREEIARRRPDRLDAGERALLAAWGYPFVLDRFRFHMTLTGALPEATGMAAELERELEALLAEPVPVAEVCRFSEDGDGRFHLVKRFALGT